MYAYPVIGQLAVADVDTEAVMNVLRPIWHAKPETASRVRGRIEAILSAAKVEGLRPGENPALWRGHQRVAAVKEKGPPGRAPPRATLRGAAFWQSLVENKSIAARALQFVIATAARYGEVAFAEWPEIDVAARLWRVPAVRMKADRDHEVPLSKAALAAFGERGEGLIFPSPMTGRPLSDAALANVIRRHTSAVATCHGMRSSFRDWAGDKTNHQREVIEAALAHAVGDETEAAYRRSTALAKRRKLMDDWAKFCASQ
jgi:integrase